MYKLIAQGSRSQLKYLGEYEGHFEEGSKGYLDVALSSQIAANLVSYLDEKLEDAGVPEHKIRVIGKVVRISFKKEIAPLVIIATAIGASFFLIALVISWKLYKLQPAIVVSTAAGIGIFVVVAVLVVIVIIATKGKLVAGPVAVGGT